MAEQSASTRPARGLSTARNSARYFKAVYPVAHCPNREADAIVFETIAYSPNAVRPRILATRTFVPNVAPWLNTLESKFHTTPCAKRLWSARCSSRAGAAPEGAPGSTESTETGEGPKPTVVLIGVRGVPATCACRLPPSSGAAWAEIHSPPAVKDESNGN